MLPSKSLVPSPPRGPKQTDASSGRVGFSVVQRETVSLPVRGNSFPQPTASRILDKYGGGPSGYSTARSTAAVVRPLSSKPPGNLEPIGSVDALDSSTSRVLDTYIEQRKQREQETLALRATLSSTWPGNETMVIAGDVTTCQSSTSPELLGMPTSPSTDENFGFSPSPEEDLEFYDVSEGDDRAWFDAEKDAKAYTKAQSTSHRPCAISTAMAAPRDAEARCDVTPGNPESQAAVPETPVLLEQGFKPRTRTLKKGGVPVSPDMKRRRNSWHLRYNGFYPDMLPSKPPEPTVEEAARAARSVLTMTKHPGGFADLLEPKAPGDPRPSALRLGSSFRARRAATPISELTPTCEASAGSPEDSSPSGSWFPAPGNPLDPGGGASLDEYLNSDTTMTFSEWRHYTTRVAKIASFAAKESSLNETENLSTATPVPVATSSPPRSSSTMRERVKPPQTARDAGSSSSPKLRLKLRRNSADDARPALVTSHQAPATAVKPDSADPSAIERICFT